MVMIVFIHGHNSTKDSFNFIKQKIEYVQHPWRDFEYNSDNGFNKNLEIMADKMDEITETDDVFFVTHSMGAIYAAYLTLRFPNCIEGAVTISAPWGGSETAQWLQLTSKSQIYKEVAPYSDIIQGLKVIDLPGFWQSIVTTEGGSDLIRGPNDGILSVESMTARNDVHYEEVRSNHSEVLLSLRTVEIIREAIEQTKEV